MNERKARTGLLSKWKHFEVQLVARIGSEGVVTNLGHKCVAWRENSPSGFRKTQQCNVFLPLFQGDPQIGEQNSVFENGNHQNLTRIRVCKQEEHDFAFSVRFSVVSWKSYQNPQSRRFIQGKPSVFCVFHKFFKMANMRTWGTWYLLSGRKSFIQFQ